MNLKYLFLFIFAFATKEIINSSKTENKFSLTLVDANIYNAEYIRPTISEDGYLYIVTGENDPNDNDPNRYIIKYDINSASYIETITFKSDINYMRGEPYIIGANSQYLFITSFSDDPYNIGTYEIINLRDKTKRRAVQDDTIHGYRRVVKKDGSDIYLANILNWNSIHITKMSIISETNGLPNFGNIKENSDIGITSQAMISCDFTKYKGNIICAYFSENLKASITSYDSNLNVKYSKEFEETDNFDDDHFIKIVYLKDDSDFIMMNAQSDPIIRMRYFRYTNDYITHKLKDFIKNDNNYLDIENTQYKGFNGKNDIIAVDSNKIIKIFGNTEWNNIIITVIQIDDYIPSMSIKIYYLINDNFHNDFFQARIEMMKNSILVCTSTVPGSWQRKPGYFFINFPNSTDTTLRSNKIIINNLIKIENKLFDLEPKFKVLSIPSNFIFVNKLNSIINERNNILDKNDELILRQYPINVDEKILKYQAIATGHDFGYSHLKIYPPDTVLKNEELVFDGRIGQIKINIQYCLSGYHYLEYDRNLCTNFQPKNYYLDTASNTYRACSSSCDECNIPKNDTFMNCINCKLNYYMTEDTKSCYNRNKDNYYLDSNNILRRCHQNCLRCSSSPKNDTFMKCITCQPNYYMTEDTESCYNEIIDNYYLNNNNILSRCHPNCLRCNSNPLNETYMNCITCQPNYFMTEDTESCYNEIINNYYLDVNNTLRRCHKNCRRCSSAPLNDTYMNCIICQLNYNITEDTKSCYDEIIDNYYLDGNILRRCHENCLHCSSSPTNETYMNCLTCQQSYFMTEDTESCYNDVIDNYYLDVNNTLRRCHSNCLRCNSIAKNDTYMNCLICQPNYFMTEDTESCYNEVIDNYYLDANNTLRRCHPNCLRCSSAQINDTYMNCISCQPNYFITEDTKSCYNEVIDNYYLDIDRILKRCHKNCLKCITAPKSSTYMNCITCQKNYFITEESKSCYKQVIDNYYLDNYYFDHNIFMRCRKHCLHCFNITDEETFNNCLKCYHNFVTADKNTCYNYVNNNIFGFYNLTGVNTEEIYLETEIDQHIVKLTTTDYLMQNKNINKTTIDLGKCEYILKEFYNIHENKTLFIKIVEVEEEGMIIPKVEYEIYNLLDEYNFEKLNLSLCRNEKIEISIPISINDSIDIYNSSSGYYNDICYLTTSVYNTDISLKDRREEFINNNLTLCEENCVLIEYDYIFQKAKCSCDTKVNIPLIEDIKFDKERLKNNFIKINNIANLNVVKCYKIVFQKQNLKFNYGFYILDIIFLIFFICLFLFYFKYYHLFLEKIREFISPLKNEHINTNSKNIYNSKQIKIIETAQFNGKKKVIIKIKKKKKNKNENELKNDKPNIFTEINENDNCDNSKSRNLIDIKNINIKEKNINKIHKFNDFININNMNDNNLDYNDLELSSLPYKEAIKLDKRTYMQYYIFLLKTNHLLLFSFYPYEDYNSRIIKIFLYFLNFALDFTLNALFFSDETMHQIYEDKGSFNFIYQIPQILYSTILSYILSSLINYFSLTEENIEKIKEEKRKNLRRNIEIKKLIKKIKIKFIIFFVFNFVLLLIFWFYISCFCGVYINTQIHLIKDSCISFFMSHLTPFFSLLIPATFRICALRAEKKDKNYIYKISQFIENF